VNEKSLDKYIQLFKALANEERLEIVRLLKKNKEMCAQEVEHHFFLEQSTTSHHLNTLKRAGITKARKEGRKVFYSIDSESFSTIWNGFSTFMLND
jgi:ArsR family transcriptional regulator, arsenate/arsenite/antimonite-responsive transcriptional repressor